MSYATPVKQQAARKSYVCDWCNESIKPGEQYARWRWFDGYAATVTVHSECYEALIELNFGDDGWEPGDNPRGCNCGWENGCERCAEREKA